eukprot:gene35703-46317_t
MCIGIIDDPIRLLLCTKRAKPEIKEAQETFFRSQRGSKMPRTCSSAVCTPRSQRRNRVGMGCVHFFVAAAKARTEKKVDSLLIEDHSHDDAEKDFDLTLHSQLFFDRGDARNSENMDVRPEDLDSGGISGIRLSS